MGIRYRTKNRDSGLATLCPMVILLLGIALMGACSSRSGPESAVEAYAQAVSENRCVDALAMLSNRTKYAVEALRLKPQHPHTPIPLEEYYCNKLIFEDCKLGKMAVKDMTVAAAVVSMPCGRTQDSFLPGFASPFLKYEPRDTELVREDGEWRLVMTYVIKIVDVREKVDSMRAAPLQREEQLRRERVVTPTPNRGE